MLTSVAQYCRSDNVKGAKTMLKKTMLAGAMAAAFAPGFAIAQQAPASPHKLEGNVGFYSQYIFRGLTQTDRKPAIQGGFDYEHSSGFYAGTWASNVSWLRDFGSYSDGGSGEFDFYGGLKGDIGKSGFNYDVGLLYYWYPGTVVPGAVKANTFEAYGALGWKWITAKYSYSLNNKTFGVTDSRGTWYFDLTAEVPLGDTGLTAVAHWGKQKYRGDAAPGVSNDSLASYTDWKLGVSYALPKDFTIGAYYTDTSMNATREAFYTTPTGRFVGKGTGTIFIQKTF